MTSPLADFSDKNTLTFMEHQPGPLSIHKRVCVHTSVSVNVGYTYSYFCTVLS